MPTAQEIRHYKEAISARYSLLHDVYAMADGLKLYLQESGNGVIQNMFYNGWQHDHYVGNVLVFVPSGVVIAAAYNAPGCLHDSVIAEWGNVYQKLEETFENHGATCVVDSAFSKGDYPFLITSAQDMPMSNDRNIHQKAQQAISVRQASEWGMRAFQGSFPRLKDRFLRGVWREEDHTSSRHFALQFENQISGHQPDTQYVHAISGRRS